ncbi:MAG: hypothetical protein FWC47_03090 [Oscillospiraceae bacterium]|nr:hypothetical protein [Oscillospiraceae bacterium]
MHTWDANNPVAIKAWEDVSAIYANQISGEVRAVIENFLKKEIYGRILNYQGL